MSLLIGFSGQGSQHHSMFKLLMSDKFGKLWLQEARDILGINLGDEVAVERACQDVIQVQCLLVILSVGTYHAIRHYAPIVPAFICGYSLGEVAAFCASTNMAVSDICELVTSRATVMQQATKYICSLGVLKGNITIDDVKVLATTYGCYIAIINGRDHIIVGGRDIQLRLLLEEARTRGVSKAEVLRVNVASHTPLLAKATLQFNDYLKKIPATTMEYPILNAITQELSDNPSEMVSFLARELSEVLHWDKVMAISKEYGISVFLELGPGSSLKTMFLANVPGLKAYAMEEFSSLNGLADFL